jgi:hypothetical protein
MRVAFRHRPTELRAKDVKSYRAHRSDEPSDGALRNSQFLRYIIILTLRWSDEGISPIVFGIAAGLLYGAIDTALMLPMEFPDKPTALLGAFASRFAIGFLIPLVELPMPSWVVGGLVGLLVSLPDAVITKAYAPIMASGLIGGIVIGWAAGRFVQ